MTAGSSTLSLGAVLIDGLVADSANFAETVKKLAGTGLAVLLKGNVFAALMQPQRK